MYYSWRGKKGIENKEASYTYTLPTYITFIEE